jgi:hypothetical protein
LKAREMCAEITPSGWGGATRQAARVRRDGTPMPSSAVRGRCVPRAGG